MSWIPCDADLGSHPKLWRMSHSLEISRPSAVGHILLLWHWCAKHAKDGDITECCADQIAFAMMWEGDSQVLLKTLIECRLLDRENGRLTVHNWEKHAGARLRCLGADAARKRAARQRAVNEEFAR